MLVLAPVIMTGTVHRPMELAVPDLNRRIAGAKSRLFPERGRPARWEVKASDTIKSNRWSPPNPPIADPVPAHFRRAGKPNWTFLNGLTPR